MAKMTLEALREKFSGTVIVPNDASYAEARKSYIAEGTPLVVLRPLSAQDVTVALQYVRDNELLVSVRSGGHSMAALSTNDDGVVVDLSGMHDVEIIDEAKGLVRVGGGAKWGEVAKALKPHRLALTSGDTVSVGVGGLTLAGGIGWMVRKYGLTIDSMLAAEVVTADGRILRASEQSEPELFWAIRGGGGNFGVVTSLEFQAQKIGKVQAGMIMYPLDNLEALIKSWRDYMRTAPDELTTSLTLMPSFGDAPPAAMLLCCYVGDKATAAKVLEPLKQFGNMQSENITEKDYADVLEEAHPPAGMKVVVQNILAKTLDDACVAAIVASTQQPGMRIIQIRALGGVMQRIAPDATAFAYRDSEVMMFCGALFPADTDAKTAAAALDPWQPIAVFGQGAYANFLSNHGEAEVHRIYPTATYERLAQIKRSYDPTNLFHHNFNIPPA